MEACRQLGFHDMSHFGIAKFDTGIGSVHCLVPRFRKDIYWVNNLKNHAAAKLTHHMLLIASLMMGLSKLLAMFQSATKESAFVRTYSTTLLNLQKKLGVVKSAIDPKGVIDPLLKAA